ncbi:TraR/DksA C4-type zinc finger protein [Azospirillum picis]|uniref:Phage/conjugal plasmid C-4 type zinc finger TraR family protein n=1 Tax=Azospirillum picis TaxID=488438 RepID=A0ABU0MPF2_9PROT|nr:phage/conjugal plasmid C-4 type zinc finger TraR family protein [Azospirillum picis]MDQ0535124.1 phage/conjugal plasmid C-4 type zinc finger TraR family protein [Azospirillum picis]
MADIGDDGEACSAFLTAAAVSVVRGRLTQVGSAACVDCDTAIPPARRVALPSATRCVDCQDRHERGL